MRRALFLVLKDIDNCYSILLFLNDVCGKCGALLGLNLYCNSTYVPSVCVRVFVVCVYNIFHR